MEKRRTATLAAVKNKQGNGERGRLSRHKERIV